MTQRLGWVRALALALALASAFYLFILVAPALAQHYERVPPGTPPTLDSACGAEGVGKAPDGAIVRMTLAGNRVDARGHWIACDRPCPGTQRFPVWSEGASQCTTEHPDATSATHWRRDQGAMHGASQVFVADTGRFNGLYVYRCDDGVKVPVVARCRDTLPAGSCAELAEVKRRSGGATYWYTYDARQAPVPAGGVVTARTPDGRGLLLVCSAGKLVSR